MNVFLVFFFFFFRRRATFLRAAAAAAASKPTENSPELRFRRGYHRRRRLFRVERYRAWGERHFFSLLFSLLFFLCRCAFEFEKAEQQRDSLKGRVLCLKRIYNMWVTIKRIIKKETLAFKISRFDHLFSSLSVLSLCSRSRSLKNLFVENERRFVSAALSKCLFFNSSLLSLSLLCLCLLN